MQTSLNPNQGAYGRIHWGTWEASQRAPEIKTQSMLLREINTWDVWQCSMNANKVWLRIRPHWHNIVSAFNRRSRDQSWFSHKLLLSTSTHFFLESDHRQTMHQFTTSKCISLESCAYNWWRIRLNLDYNARLPNLLLIVPPHWTDSCIVFLVIAFYLCMSAVTHAFCLWIENLRITWWINTVEGVIPGTVLTSIIKTCK